MLPSLNKVDLFILIYLIILLKLNVIERFSIMFIANGRGDHMTVFSPHLPLTKYCLPFPSEGNK